MSENVERLGEKGLRAQVEWLLQELREGGVTIHQFMQLLHMAYSDFLEFHPEELDEMCYGELGLEHRKLQPPRTIKKEGS